MLGFGIVSPWVLHARGDLRYSDGAMSQDRSKSAAVIVAHPDDETLWAGGAILSHPLWNWYVVTLCRAGDPDRAPKFYRALQDLGAKGNMADLDDGPQQKPLAQDEVQAAILKLLPSRHFDLILTHNPTGEYTRHLRHEETSRAVIALWQSGQLSTDELWTFAFNDGGKSYLPRAVEAASVHHILPEDIWRRKYRIITQTYGFPSDGFEARTTPRSEAFWRFANPSDAQAWLERGGAPL